MNNFVAPVLGYGRSNDGFLVVRMAGGWKVEGDLPSAGEVEQKIESEGSVRGIAFDTEGLTDWDSGLLAFLVAIITYAGRNDLSLRQEGLPQGIRHLLRLAFVVPEQKAVPHTGNGSFLSALGEVAIRFWQAGGSVLAFLGEASVGFLRILTGKGKVRVADLLAIIQECGVEALPIVSLISILVGLILAFFNHVQPTTI